MEDVITRFGQHIRVMGAFLASIIAAGGANDACAVPSFARQTGQACEECHVGAFGPQLKPYGRDFKLYGYLASDGSTGHFPPLAVAVQSSFTHTQEEQPAPAPDTRYGQNKSNNNAELDQVNLFYAGRITDHIGAFINTTYDGVADRISWDNADIRAVKEGIIGGKPYVAGITINNGPTMSDLWNSTPIWGFPYDTSSVAPTPAAATLIDGGLSQLVGGAGVYTMWDRWIYLEFDTYAGLGKTALSGLGMPTGGIDKYDGVIPYWRAAIQHQITPDHYFEIGTYGLSAESFPAFNESAGTTDRKTDIALDANYQWAVNPDNYISAHTTYIHEDLELRASSILGGSNPDDTLNTYRADVSYSYKDIIIPTLQYFQTWGSSDAAYWGTANGNPDNAGYVMEIAYVPFGKADSSIQNANMRLSLQYIDYAKFDGTSYHASDNNTILLQLWMAWAPW